MTARARVAIAICLAAAVVPVAASAGPGTAVAAADAKAAAGSKVPIWQRLLRWSGGESSATTVPTTMMGPHMQMSVRRPMRRGDAQRADAIVEAARRVLERYRDVAVAERDGYRAFAPRGVVGEEVHYTNHWKASREQRELDLDQPGSILYKRTVRGMVAVGVMYIARRDATEPELDARLPTSHAVWHRHVHFCGWPSDAPKHEWDGPDAKFGFAGSIHTEAACRDAGGYWIPIVLGWMTHVYPHETDFDRRWLGDHAMDPGGGAGHRGHGGHKH